MALTFGVTVLPDPPYQRLVELIQLAERHGFEYGWTYDSHVLWQESTPTLALAAAATESIKLGHMVTNPGTREPTVVASMYATLHDISDGRMVMGIGRGDSARRYINQQPVRVGRFEDAVRMIKPLMNGEKVGWNETELELAWVRPELPPIEMHVAGYGPKVLAIAGRHADGVIIQLADPDIIQWTMDTARKAAEEAGRDPAALKCIVCAPSHISDDLATAREQVRWFPAMVSNHVRDLIRKLIQGGTVVNASESSVADVLLDGEEILAVGSLGEVDAEVIDASGCYVLPGLIDNHTHMAMPFGGTRSIDDYDTGTRAAAAGGTTCIVDFVIQQESGGLRSSLEEWQGRAAGAAHVDYGFHMAITNADDGTFADMEPMVEEGLCSFKVFLALWDMGVEGGRITPSELVGMTSTTIARRFGLARKGSIAPGFDADVVVFDPSTPFEFSTHTSHMNVDYDLFDGESSTGSVRHTLCRGAMVYDRGDIVTQPGHGRFVPRSLEARTPVAT